MARRASSGTHPGQLIGIALAVLGFVVIGALLFKLIAGDFLGGGGSKGAVARSAGSATLLNLTTYLDNGNSLRGNTYRIEGRVEETLRWTPDRGRLISFEAEDASTASPVPVLVPESLGSVNIERGAPLTMVVKVDRDGTLVAETIHD